MKKDAVRAKPVSEATRRLLDEMEQDADAPKNEDKLEQVRDGIRRLRDTEKEKADLEEKLKIANGKIKEITDKTLVDLFDEAGIDKLGIPAEGNMPPYEVTLIDYYHANIPEENQPAAYKWMKETKNEDMIKTTFVVSFGLGETRACKAFRSLLKKNKVPHDEKQGVPWNTLTAFVKGEFKAGRPITKKVMDMLGVTVGRVAKVVKQKEKK
jgi:hypothetical protein